MSVTNQGTIAADAAGQTVNISPTNFTSTGTLNVGPGNMSVNPQSAWTSSGSNVNVSGGTLTIDGTYTTGAGIGTWTRSGGSVTIAGIVDNTGGTLTLNASTGTWDLTGGLITGGTVNLLAGGGLGVDSSPANRLSALTFNGNIALADAGDRLSFGVGVTVNGVITVSGASAEIGLANGASLNSEVVFPGTAAQGASDPPGAMVSFTLGASANLHAGPFTLGTQYGGSVWGSMSVTNQGTIAADAAGQTVNISPTNFTSTGTLNVGPGNMTINPQSAWTSSGSNVNVSGGSLTIDGTYTTGVGHRHVDAERRERDYRRYRGQTRAERSTSTLPRERGTSPAG